MPRPLTLEEPQGDPVDTINGTFDLRAGIHQCAHATRKRHDTVRPPWLGQDGNMPPRAEPHGSRGTIEWQLLFPGLGPLRWRRPWLVQILRWLLEQPLQQLLLLLLKLLQFLLPTLFQLLLEMHLRPLLLLQMLRHLLLCLLLLLLLLQLRLLLLLLLHLLLLPCLRLLLR